MYDQNYIHKIFPINPKYSDNRASANSVDLDQTTQNAATDHGLHSLSLI